MKIALVVFGLICLAIVIFPVFMWNLVLRKFLGYGLSAGPGRAAPKIKPGEEKQGFNRSILMALRLFFTIMIAFIVYVIHLSSNPNW